MHESMIYHLACTSCICMICVPRIPNGRKSDCPNLHWQHLVDQLQIPQLSWARDSMTIIYNQNCKGDCQQWYASLPRKLAYYHAWHVCPNSSPVGSIMNAVLIFVQQRIFCASILPLTMEIKAVKACVSNFSFGNWFFSGGGSAMSALAKASNSAQELAWSSSSSELLRERAVRMAKEEASSLSNPSSTASKPPSSSSWKRNGERPSLIENRIGLLDHAYKT